MVVWERERVVLERARSDLFAQLQQQKLEAARFQPGFVGQAEGQPEQYVSIAIHQSSRRPHYVSTAS